MGSTRGGVLLGCTGSPVLFSLASHWSRREASLFSYGASASYCSTQVYGAKQPWARLSETVSGNLIILPFKSFGMGYSVPRTKKITYRLACLQLSLNLFLFLSLSFSQQVQKMPRST